MSVTTYLNLGFEKVSKESPKEGRKCANPNRWSKWTACNIADSILYGINKNLLSQKGNVKARPILGAMITGMYNHLKPLLKIILNTTSA